MRRYMTTAALAAATLALAGCQNPAVKVESKQEQLKHLQDQWNAIQSTYLADCPLADMRTGEPNKSPHCQQMLVKSTSVQKQMTEISRQIAAE